jgi:prolyl oligopeptidase
MECGGRYFSLAYRGAWSRPVLTVHERWKEPGRVVIDPATVDAESALCGVAIDPAGDFVAYSLSRAGSDWQEWRVRRVDDGNDLPDRCPFSRNAGASWTHDQRGFFYLGLPRLYPPPTDPDAPVQAPSLRYHRLGTPTEEDVVVRAQPDHPDWGFDGWVTEDGRYLVVSTWRGSDPTNLLDVIDLSTGQPVPLQTSFDATTRVVGNDHTTFWLATTWQGANGRVVEVDLRSPERHHWRPVVADQGAPLLEVFLAGDQFFVVLLQHLETEVRRFRRDGTPLAPLSLPRGSVAQGLSGRRTSSELFFSVQSLIQPETICRFDLSDESLEELPQPALPFSPDDFVLRYESAPAQDGTAVPMVLASRRESPPGPAPTVLFCYGGFGMPALPTFQPSVIAWLELGGTYVVAGIRGGGERGVSWHEAGRGRAKQRSILDLVSCAEWLQRTGVTSPAHLALVGGSNGGLVVTAALTQRPDLCAAVVAIAPLTDMVRFTRGAAGGAWVAEYGDPADPEDGAALLAYSPLHAVRPGIAYPAVLVETGGNDERVPPWHGFKFVAALQQAQSAEPPVLLRHDPAVGHHFDESARDTVVRLADRWSFIADVVGGVAPKTPEGTLLGKPAIGGPRDRRKRGKSNA